ncbi:MAG: RAMP superfamily CRISPR-associated protein [Promethearchaeota archaeon]
MDSINQINGVNLDIIKKRLIITGKIKLKSQMHIGTGEDTIRFSPDASILLTKLDPMSEDFYPYIPRSTLKGIFRSEIEQIARALSKLNNQIFYVCSGEKEYCRVEIDENKYTEPCVVCKLFGGSDLASHVIFSDALPTEETQKNYRIKIKPGISIDRKKQITKDGSLFFIETLQPGAEFNFEMIIDNISKDKTPNEFKLLRILFYMVKLGFISIGGMKSTGMGKFDLVNVQVKELLTKEDFLFPENVKSQDLSSYFEI